MLCRKHAIPRCWNVVFKWLKGQKVVPAAGMKATPLILSGLLMVISGLSALDELCMENARQLATLAVVVVWKVPLGTEHGVRDP